MFIRILSAALLLLLAGCSRMQVQSDYDPAFDFTSLERFAVIYPKQEGLQTLTQSRIAQAITAEMDKKGYRAAEKSDADFIIIFHTDVTTKKQVVTDFQTVGFYPYYGYGYGIPMTVPVEREYRYDEGKLIIDAFTPKDSKIFWRAVATDELKSFKTPEKRTAYIQKVIDEILKPFPGKREE